MSTDKNETHLKLQIEDLEIDSFDTLPAGVTANAGTVRGLDPTVHYTDCSQYTCEPTETQNCTIGSTGPCVCTGGNCTEFCGSTQDATCPGSATCDSVCGGPMC